MQHSRLDARSLIAIAGLAFAALFAQPATADWLITTQGQLIETDGPWSIDGRTLTYTDTHGAERSLSLDNVDLEASKETTALRSGQTYEPPKRSRPEPFHLESPTAAARADDEPKIILYQTSWCGYCRKARKLLDQLDADYVAKDVEKSRTAASEFQSKNGGRGGVPLIDIDGELIKGYNEKMIRKLVSDLQKEEAKSKRSET